MSDALAEALIRLETESLQDRIGAVEDLGHVANRIVDRVIEEFEQPGTARFLIFERLGRFGSLILDPLEQLLNRADDRELRVLTAAALLSQGSELGLQDLLATIDPNDELVCVAVRTLSRCGVEEAIPRIEKALIECDVAGTSTVECLAAALRVLGRPLNHAIRRRLQAIEPEWLRDSLLQ
jgi:hypothetical protein